LHFAIGGNGLEFKKEKPLAPALWYFVQPAAIPSVYEFIIAKGYHEDGLRCGKLNMHLFNGQYFEELVHYCGVDEKTEKPGEAYVTWKEQWHGEWLEFEPGLLHQVITLQPCCKLAYDTYKFDWLQRYMDVWLYILCQFMEPLNPEDYMNILGLIKKEMIHPWTLSGEWPLRMEKLITLVCI
jgi:hypothetical protein